MTRDAQADHHAKGSEQISSKKARTEAQASARGKRGECSPWGKSPDVGEKTLVEEGPIELTSPPLTD